ncbi:hypothetical protein N7492_006667 [Penicillium capsulatum]|uniref:Uncharacterized protein n=1 Tax=Penicillium capsulatum TaxID=69766 RepID=A0A9W9I3C7_9EURO|nr:hypothetical protein N7492_006667 [Penicillium capsulatum]
MSTYIDRTQFNHGIAQLLPPKAIADAGQRLDAHAWFDPASFTGAYHPFGDTLNIFEFGDLPSGLALL